MTINRLEHTRVNHPCACLIQQPIMNTSEVLVLTSWALGSMAGFSAPSPGLRAGRGDDGRGYQLLKDRGHMPPPQEARRPGEACAWPPAEDACTACCMDAWMHGCKQDQDQMGRWGEGPGPPPEEEASARDRLAEDTSCSKTEDTGLLHRRPCSKEGKIDATERERERERMHRWRVALFQMASPSP